MPSAPSSKLPSVPERIRVILRGLADDGGTVTPRELAFETGAGRTAVNRALRDMLRRGEIERPAPGRYRYVATGYEARPADLRRTILRAVMALGQFNCREIAVISGAEKTWVGAVVRDLVVSGDVELLGKAKDETTGGQAYRFRVRNADEFYLTKILGKPRGKK